LYEFLNNVIDFTFLVDILINFRTTYINQSTGDEISEPKMIAKHYVLGPRFWIDVVSTIPFDKIYSSGFLGDFFSLLGMLKIVRVSRISKIIANLNVRQDLKAVRFGADNVISSSLKC